MRPSTIIPGGDNHLETCVFPLHQLSLNQSQSKELIFQPLSYTPSSFKRENIFSKYLFFQFFTKSISKGFKKQFSFQVKAEDFLRENFAEIPWDTVRESLSEYRPQHPDSVPGADKRLRGAAARPAAGVLARTCAEEKTRVTLQAPVSLTPPQLCAINQQSRVTSTEIQSLVLTVLPTNEAPSPLPAQ